MAEKTLNTVIVLRNDSSINWANSEVVLKQGEIGVSYLDSGNVMVKAGDGVHKWSELRQVESVLENNLLLTYSFGKHIVPTGGFVDAGGKDMTFSQWFADSLKKTVEPIVKTYPNVSLSASVAATDTGNYEIGSYITSVSYTGSFGTKGDYNVNGKTVGSGLTDSNMSWKVTLSGNENSEKTSSTGSYTINEQIKSTSEVTYATVNATATIDVTNVVVPTNNLGEARPDAKIKGFDAAGTLSKSLSAGAKVTGFRNSWYYVGEDCTTTVDSAFIRGCTGKGSNTTSFGTITIPEGTKRVMIAVPGSHSLTSVIDVDGMGLDVKENFTTMNNVPVNGANGYEAANYTVFVAENANGMKATKFTFTIA